MNILTTVFLTVVMLMNLLLLVSMRVGSKDVADRGARLGLSFLTGCIVVDMICILGGALAW